MSGASTDTGLPSVLHGTARSSPARRILDGVPRNDPTDTGGLFIGRRPGTGPLHYRAEPERGGGGRQRTDGVLAAAVLVVETLLCLSVWGPQPLGWLWIGSQVDYHAGSHMLGTVAAFFGILASLFVTLSLGSRLDRVWRLLRRAAGHNQRDGALARIFGTTAVVALIAFGVWFLLIQGPAPSFSSS
jgi:hypothetical protein